MEELTKSKVMADLTAEMASYIGIREEGWNRSSIIDKFNQRLKLPLGSPYCLSALLYVISTIEKKHGVSFRLPVTGHCQTFFNKAKPSLKFSSPVSGDIVIWQYLGTSKGHAGYVERVVDRSYIRTIEFNTRDERGVVREGDGCYRRERSIKGSGIMRVMGFVRISDALNIEENSLRLI